MPADLCRAFALEKAKHMTVAQNRIHGLLTENFKESYNVKKISAIALIIIGIMSLRTSLFGSAFCILLGIFLLTH